MKKKASDKALNTHSSLKNPFKDITNSQNNTTQNNNTQNSSKKLKLAHPPAPTNKQVVDALENMSPDDLAKIFENNPKLQKKLLAVMPDKKQLPKKDVEDYISTVLNTHPSNKFLVDLNISDTENNEMIKVGRPPVTGSSTKQLRHATPFSFITNIIISQLKAAESPGKFTDLLFENIKVFFDNKSGVCLSKKNFQKETKNSPFKAVKIKTNKSEWFLLDETLNSNLDIFTDNDSQSSAYEKKKIKFLKYSMQKLKEAIHDDNTLTLACEYLVRIIFTLSNKKALAAFPEEGNTQPFEIRLYKNKEAAASPAKQRYEVLTNLELYELIEAKESLNYRIRLVNNEGALVKKVPAALSLLNIILEKMLTLEEVEKDIDNYNKSYNDKIKFTNMPDNKPDKKMVRWLNDNYNNKINKEVEEEDYPSLSNDIVNHTAKQLYRVFDFKPLENLALVPKELKKLTALSDSLTIYNTATGKKTSGYTFVDGQEYRKMQIPGAKGYNNEVTFRKENKYEDINIIRDKVIDHVKISLFPFTIINTTENYNNVLKSFTTLVEKMYLIKKTKLSKAVEKLHNYGSDSESTNSSSDSEIQGAWFISDKGETSILSLLGEEQSNVSSD